MDKQGMKTYITSLEQNLKLGNATEHTHRPALKTLIESLEEPSVRATNEPKRIACGAPDYVVSLKDMVIGYIEAKDVGKPLSEEERSAQLKRYRNALSNLILTDYVEFRWYVDGELRQQGKLALVQPGGKLKKDIEGVKAVEDLLHNFLAHQPQNISTPKDLAGRMARLTHIIRDIIITAFDTNQTSDLLQGWRDAFAKVLITDMGNPEKTPDFADMFAQTLSYGLFTARIMDTTPESFTRQEAQYLIPKSNPFLRDFFIQISGPQLEDEPFVSFVDDLVNLLAHTDMDSVLSEFGHRTKQEDPVVHFYETFLAAYDPALRESRGVYYTPEPVVSYIVRSVDHLLKAKFNCPDGLADSVKVTVPNYDTRLKIKGTNKTRRTTTSHKVLILDPATGTGTFLYSVVDHIRQRFMLQNNAGMWPGYVKNHLLPRLFGFELLMAPYAVAHFKLSLQLAGRDLPEEKRKTWAYLPENNERLQVYLTNTLEEANEYTGLPLFTQWIANETNAANSVKLHLPVLVVMGNPPYSGHSANKGEWIDSLLKGKLSQVSNENGYYKVDGRPLGERNTKWLQDDYVKFIRFGQWRIDRSGQGILAFVTNHSYLDNPTFRGMRQSLMQTFSEIYLFDLHGNAKKNERAPDGGPDQNVFDIQQGVAIGIFIKQQGKKGPAKVFHSNLLGTRKAKYQWLFEQDVEKTEWKVLEPESPNYFFTPQDTTLLGEYEAGWSIGDIFPVNSLGIATARDNFAVDLSKDELWMRIQDFISLPVGEAREKYNLGKDARDWKVHFAQEDLLSSGPSFDRVTMVLYRPFDVRYSYYTGNSRGFICMPRAEVMQNFLHEEQNPGLCFIRRSRTGIDSNFYVTQYVTDKTVLSSADNANIAPLYIYPKDKDQLTLCETSSWKPDSNHGNRIPNLNPEFIKTFEEKLGLAFASDGGGDLENCFGPGDIFAYIYAILHCPAYRSRYEQFLKIDFPRIPLISDSDLFAKLFDLGRELIDLHLLKSPKVGNFITSFPHPGENLVEKGYPKYVQPEDAFPGRVQINKQQYFEGVAPEVWEFHIGGYQVLHKWLKDRSGRKLSYEDLSHYQKIVVALKETILLMPQIDKIIHFSLFI